MGPAHAQRKGGKFFLQHYLRLDVYHSLPYKRPYSVYPYGIFSQKIFVYGNLPETAPEVRPNPGEAPFWAKVASFAQGRLAHLLQQSVARGRPCGAGRLSPTPVGVELHLSKLWVLLHSLNLLVYILQ